MHANHPAVHDQVENVDQTETKIVLILQVEMFAVLVNRSLSTAVGNHSIISHHIKNIRPRFRLLHLGLLLLQGNITSQPILRNVLREKIYHGALDYFRYIVLFLLFCIFLFSYSYSFIVS